MIIDGDTAHIIVAGSNFHRKTGADRFQNLQRLCHNFGANAVAR